MVTSTPQDPIASALVSARDELGVSRGRCYVMNASGVFRLAASYGFLSRSGPDETLDPGHALIERVQRQRRPFFVNSLRDAGVLEPMMERERYSRSLTAPIYDGSRLIGILELQDKLGGAPFDAEDVSRAGRVIERIKTILAGNDTSVGAPEPMAPEDREALFLEPRPSSEIEFPAAPDLFSSGEGQPSISAAQPARATDSSAPASPGEREGASESTPGEALVFKGFTTALLLSPEVDAVVFSIWSPERADIYVGARCSFAAAGRDALLANLESALRSVAPAMPVPAEKVFHMEFPLGHSTGEIRDPGGVQTSVVFSDSITGLLTLVFPQRPVLTPQGTLKEIHRLVRAAILRVRGGDRYRLAFRSLVAHLIEPDLRTFPQLKIHSLAVAALCRRFAGVLRLPPDTVEQITVAGLLHDIGLKDLSIPYEKISGRRALDVDELSKVRQHAVLGASLLSRIDFPYAIASLVRHHHERFDGSGYPDGLVGERIPLGSRIIGLAEAYDAMVSPHSYRAPISRDAALDIILSKAGSQFDPDLARRFSELVRSSPRTEADSLAPLPS